MSTEQWLNKILPLVYGLFGLGCVFALRASPNGSLLAGAILLATTAPLVVSQWLLLAADKDERQKTAEIKKLTDDVESLNRKLKELETIQSVSQRVGTLVLDSMMAKAIEHFKTSVSEDLK